MIMQSGWQTGNGVWELTLLCLVRTLEMRVTKQLWKISIAWSEAMAHLCVCVCFHLFH